ncbi:hypothetical protein BKA93DRAFT_742269 [Sparassis latifolia]|uniref:Uncharacterized protein n=1 Tax=Sparassis crispa TaxID=139825 RepID=A0A401GPB7_9APHY|nr:hypothetical protein SCP_0600350 [Sparassis crispa]GBE84058.1 hypothetical protein SCP_0600350 [Sparassis crispa]
MLSQPYAPPGQATVYTPFSDAFSQALLFVPQQPFQPGGAIQGPDPNSPEVFRQNIQVVQGHVARVQGLARSALSGMEQAYHPSTSPLQTSADLEALKEALLALVDVLRQTGVGALPLAPPDPTRAPGEEQLVAETGAAVQALYEGHRRLQESADAVGSLLVAGEGRR